MSSRLTRGRVPSSSVGMCLDGRTERLRAWRDRVSSLRPPICARPGATDAAGSARLEHVRVGAIRWPRGRRAARPGRRCRSPDLRRSRRWRAAATRLMSRALAPSLVVAFTSAPASSRTRTISGASPPGPAATAACSGVRPVSGSRRSTSAPGVQQQPDQRPAGRRRPPRAAHRRRRRRRAPAAAARSRRHRRAPPRTAGPTPRRPVGGPGAVVELARSSCVDVVEVGGARGVEHGAELEQQRHQLGAELQRDVQRCPVVLGPGGEVRPGADEHPDDLGLPLGDGEVQRRPAALPSRSTVRVEQPRGGLDAPSGSPSTSPAAISRPSRWTVMRVVTRGPRSRSVRSGPSDSPGSDDVAPDGQQRAEEGGHAGRSRAAADRPARRRADPAPGTSPSWPPARRRASTCRHPTSRGSSGSRPRRRTGTPARRRSRRPGCAPARRCPTPISA